ncbi:MAG: type II toxin-antitoxin system VapB family antitoxin [Lamprobacter sp.]|uniref:type II toxin-antitoxin system VapB family antitoxin n=1 Tax=Lamprobacter sp. TaxID=3100796 RepID=UPI002B258C13|nr:type II toxin-antitoxin system VapB family antitoxin [Lamprobacter sp.]MEA3641190.1 type II toxin-antitoxin system VapB family antitoxin [Lamprobacter sp.]
MQVMIDDDLVRRAQELTGLSDVHAIVEHSLRLMIEQRQPLEDVAGGLSRYAHHPAPSFEQERELTWSKVAHDADHS